MLSSSIISAMVLLVQCYMVLNGSTLNDPWYYPRVLLGVRQGSHAPPDSDILQGNRISRFSRYCGLHTLSQTFGRPNELEITLALFGASSLLAKPPCPRSGGGLHESTSWTANEKLHSTHDFTCRPDIRPYTTGVQPGFIQQSNRHLPCISTAWDNIFRLKYLGRI